MALARKSLRIPAQLCVVVLSGAAAFACSSSQAPGSDASVSFEAGTCTIKAPPGRVCMTVCYELALPMNIPMGCEAYCDLPDAGSQAGMCYMANGNPFIDCNRT